MKKIELNDLKFFLGLKNDFLTPSELIRIFTKLKNSDNILNFEFEPFKKFIVYDYNLYFDLIKITTNSNNYYQIKAIKYINSIENKWEITEFNSNGNVIKITDSENNIEIFDYDKNNNKIYRKRNNTIIEKYYHNDNGMITKIENFYPEKNSNFIIEYYFNSDNKITKIQDSNGNIINYFYSEDNKIRTEKHSNGYIAKTIFDENGNVIYYSDNKGYYSESKYDNYNNVISINKKDSWEKVIYSKNKIKNPTKDTLLLAWNSQLELIKEGNNNYKESDYYIYKICSYEKGYEEIHKTKNDELISVHDYYGQYFKYIRDSKNRIIRYETNRHYFNIIYENDNIIDIETNLNFKYV